MLKPSHNWRKKVEEIEPEQNKRLMEWINVKDRLPEISGYYLVWRNDGDTINEFQRQLFFARWSSPNVTH